MGSAAVGMVALLALVLIPLLRRSPLLTPVAPLAMPAFLGKPLRAAMLSIPDDPNLADQTLVIVNAPDHLLFVAMAWPMRLLEGMTIPQRIRALATRGGAVEIARVD